MYPRLEPLLCSSCLHTTVPAQQRRRWDLTRSGAGNGAGRGPKHVGLLTEAVLAVHGQEAQVGPLMEKVAVREYGIRLAELVVNEVHDDGQVTLVHVAPGGAAAGDGARGAQEQLVWTAIHTSDGMLPWLELACRRHHPQRLAGALALLRPRPGQMYSLSPSRARPSCSPRIWLLELLSLRVPLPCAQAENPLPRCNVRSMS